VFYSFQPLLSDVSYFVAADKRVLQGDVPYTDIFETNPPLAFWVTMPPVWLAGTMGLPAETVFVVYALAINAGVLFFVWHLHDRDVKTGHDRNELLIILTAVTSFGMAFGFGQREYFSTLLLLPYVVSVVLRVDGQTIRTHFLVLLGLLAGMGLAFKPYFLAIPLLVEAFHLYETRSWKIIFRGDIFVMAAIVLVYPVLVWWLYPQYFTEILPMVQLTYGAYKISTYHLISNPGFVGFLIPIANCAMLIWWRGMRMRGYYVWFYAALGGLLSYFLQATGFPYHIVPALTFILVLFLLLVREPKLPRLRLWAYAIFGLSVFYNLADYMIQQKLRVAAYDELLGSAKPQRMIILTYDIGMVFPFLPAHNIQWVGHFQSLWMMPALDRKVISKTQSDFVRGKIAETVAQDLVDFYPDHVIVDRRSLAVKPTEHVGILNRLSHSSSFESAWSAYRLVSSNGSFELWERK
jgi:hypothetical protein